MHYNHNPKMHSDFCKTPEQVQLSQSKSDNWSFRTEKRTPSRKKQTLLLRFWNLTTGFTALADRIQSPLSFLTSPKWPSGQEAFLASFCVAHNLQSFIGTLFFIAFWTLLVVSEELGALWRTSPQTSSWSAGYTHGSCSCRPPPYWSWWW